MKVCISGNGTILNPYSSAYNLQLSYLAEMLLDMGHDVLALNWGFAGLQPAFAVYTYKELIEKLKQRVDVSPFTCPSFRGIVEHPKVRFMTSPYPSFPPPGGLRIDHFNHIIDEQKVDVMICLQDLGPTVLFEERKQFHCATIACVPLHYSPIDTNLRKLLTLFTKVVALCSSAAELIQKINKNVAIIPHVVQFESTVTVPRETIRKRLNIPSNAFLFLVVAGNYEQSGRKSLDTTALAFQRVLESHPEAMLWIHSAPGTQHYNLQQMLEQLELPASSYRVTFESLGRTELQKLYLTSDCLVSASKSEGFGLPTQEANLLGIPVIGTDVLAMHDWILYGRKVPPLQRSYNPFEGGWWWMPSVDGIAKAMEEVIAASSGTEIEGLTEADRTTAQEQVRSKMSLAAVQKEFDALITEVAAQVKPTWSLAALAPQAAQASSSAPAPQAQGQITGQITSQYASPWDLGSTKALPYTVQKNGAVMRFPIVPVGGQQTIPSAGQAQLVPDVPPMPKSISPFSLFGPQQPTN